MKESTSNTNTLLNLYLKNREIITYIIAGGATTLVYFVTRMLCVLFIDRFWITAVIAQVVCVLFAFFVNKYWVFRAETKDRKDFISQLIKFASGRLIVFFLDTICTFLCVDTYSSFFIKLFRLDRINYNSGLFKVFENYIGTSEKLNNFIFTFLLQIIAIIVNYIVSKFFAFKKDTGEKTKKD